jgi:hypothetical protein
MIWKLCTFSTDTRCPCRRGTHPHTHKHTHTHTWGDKTVEIVPILIGGAKGDAERV